MTYNVFGGTLNLAQSINPKATKIAQIQAIRPFRMVPVKSPRCDLLHEYSNLHPMSHGFRNTANFLSLKKKIQPFLSTRC